MRKHTIELNGKVYDAINGSVIQDVVPKKTAPTVVPTVAASPAPFKTPRQTPLQAKVARSAAAHARFKAQQPSKTLMRHAVSKPTPGFKKSINVQTALSKSTPNVIVTKPTVNTVSQSRLQRAQAVERSKQVSHYSSANVGVSPVFAHIPVQAAPQEPTSDLTAAPAPKPTNNPSDMFEQAMANATHFVDSASHHVRFKRKARMHVASMAAGSFGLLLLAGFAAYQNMPGVQLKVAGVRAGISTANPDFAAAGFAYKGVKVQGDSRIIGLSANGGTYNLTQQPTNWDSTDMINHISAIAADGTPNYKAIDAGDATVYRFGSSQATWVKNGTWYQVQGTQQLTDSQIQALAQNS